MTANEGSTLNTPDVEGPVMSILGHLNELRVHVMRAGICLLYTSDAADE